MMIASHFQSVVYGIRLRLQEQKHNLGDIKLIMSRQTQTPCSILFFSIHCWMGLLLNAINRGMSAIFFFIPR